MRCTIASGTLLIFDGTICPRVVVLADTDVSSGIVDQRLAQSIGWAWLRCTRIGMQSRSGQMQDFGKAKDRQMVEGDRIVPHSSQYRTTRPIVPFVGFDADRVGLCLDEMGSIVVALHPMLSKVR